MKIYLHLLGLKISVLIEKIKLRIKYGMSLEQAKKELEKHNIYIERMDKYKRLHEKAVKEVGDLLIERYRKKQKHKKT